MQSPAIHNSAYPRARFTLLWVIWMLGASFTVVASAQGLAPSKRDEKEASVSVTERKRPTKRAERAPTKPQIGRNQAFLIATETRLKSEIDKAIAYLSRTEKRMPPQSTARLEMLEQLVNLHLELAIYEANAEYRKYDDDYERWENAGAKGAAPKLSTAKSSRVWREIIRRADSVLKLFPRSKNADVTMFNKAVALQFLGQEKEAARAYSQLISRYPNSDKAGDAYFQLGDYYFDRTDFRNAQNNYRQALRYRRSRGYNWSLFKLGWCSYNLGNHKQALDFWKQTVAASRTADDKSAVQLRDEALRDMVYAFAELRQVNEAIAYYRANGGNRYIGQFLVLLSQRFSDIGQYGEAIKVLKRFQQEEPNAPGGPEAQKEIISLFYELSRMPAVWSELASFPRLYGPESRWAQANSGNRKLILETEVLIKDQILYYAKITHKTAQKDDNIAGYAEAMKGYELFLKSYPKAREVVEIKYLMADIEYIRKNFRAAGGLYLEIAMMGKDKALIYDPSGKKTTNVHNKSARYMLDSYYLDFEPELKALVKRKPDFSKPPMPLSPRARNFVQGCGQYRRMYPDDKKNVKTCDVYITEVYYRTNNRALSQRYLMVLATKYPNEKEGPQAVDNLIPLYRDDKNSLVEIADRLLKIPAYQKGELGAKLRELKRGAELEEITKISDSAKRAKAYEDAGRKNPKAADADRLFYNAAVDYIKAGMVSNAITMYLVVLKDYPKSPQVKESTLELAKLYERRFDFNGAAVYYVQFHERYPKEKESLPALGKACDLFVAAENNRAVSTCLALARLDADGAKGFIDRMIRAAELSRDFERMGQLITQTYIPRFQLTPDERIIAWNRIFNASGGRGAAAQQASGEISRAFQQARGNVGGEALRAVGEIAFRRALPEVQKYQAIKLAGGTVDALAASIQRKVQGIGNIQRAFDQVLATKDAYWGVAALYELGHAREVLANDLENPPGITGAPIEDVKKQLAPDAQAARQEARKFYATALESIAKFSVYGDYSQRVVSGLARMSGSRVSFEDWVVMPDFVASEVPESIAQAVGGGK